MNNNKLGIACWSGLLLAVLILFGGPAWSEQAPLRLGILPYNSTLALMKTHQPLRQFLQNRLGRPVDIFTAADYQSFLREQLLGNYDLMITPPHFAVMAMDKGYVPLVHYQARLEPILALRKDDPTVDLKGMQGRRIAMANRIAFATIVGLKVLGDNGLKPDRDFVVVERPTHGAAIAAVAVGDADGAITTTTLLGQVPEDILHNVRFISFGIRLPHVVTMGHKRLGDAELKRIKEALQAFAGSAEGRAFFKETSYLGYEELSPDELLLFKPYVAPLKQLLGPGFPQ